MESGVPNLEPACDARKWLLKRERWKEAGALDHVVCGGVWSEFRFNSSETCIHCEQSGSAEYHRYWSCPQLSNHPSEKVRGTQWMRKFFDAEFNGLECLWGRGIIPACLIPQSRALSAEDIQTRATPGFNEHIEKTQEAFTDRSGGPKWVPTRAGAVGSAVATLTVLESDSEMRVEDVGIKILTAPGRSTVPRAELWAAILPAKASPISDTIKLQVDAAYVVNGWSDTARAR